LIAFALRDNPVSIKPSSGVYPSLPADNPPLTLGFAAAKFLAERKCFLAFYQGTGNSISSRTGRTGAHINSVIPDGSAKEPDFA
jgi:hypothetical protein